MNKETSFSNLNKNTCEAIGCLAKATIKIPVQVGQLGIISLHVCKDCLSKFGDESK
jgi:hypothetical protein